MIKEAPEQSSQSVAEHAGRIVWALAWPAVALNSLQVVNSLLDTFFVGRLRFEALTALGASTNVIFLMISTAMALGTATTAIVSRAFGAGQPQTLREASRESLNMAVLGGLALGLLTYGLMPLISAFLSPATADAATKAEIAKEMRQYLGFFLLGLPAFFTIQTLAGSLRGVGDTKSPMMISGIQILLHMSFNYMLIFPPTHTSFGVTIPGFNMGLAGAGLAMCLSAWIAAIGYLLWASRTPLGAVKFAIPSLAWVKRILNVAIPAATMSLLRVASLWAFTKVLLGVPKGAEAVAALRAGFSVESIAFMPAFGLSVAAAALVGQSLGMKDPARAERLAWTAAHHAAVVSATVSILLFIGAPNLAAILITGKPAISAIVSEFVRYLCATEVLFAYAMVMVGAMQGAGDTVRPMWLTLICMWGLRVPAAWILALPVGMGATGCWLAMSATQAIQGVMSILMFQQGKWKLKEV